jgi:hypothetical protein
METRLAASEKNILLIGGISGFVLTMIGVATTETTEWGWVYSLPETHFCYSVWASLVSWPLDLNYCRAGILCPYGRTPVSVVDDDIAHYYQSHWGANNKGA